MSHAFSLHLARLMDISVRFGKTAQGALKEKGASGGHGPTSSPNDGTHATIDDLEEGGCRSWKQYKTECRPKIDFGPVVVCGGAVTVAYLRASLERIGRHPRSVGSFARPDDGPWDTVVWSEGRCVPGHLRNAIRPHLHHCLVFEIMIDAVQLPLRQSD